MTTFTPGPWTSRPTSNGTWLVEPLAIGFPVEADARLIAAAPDMYEALRALSVGWGSPDEFFGTHRNALVAAAAALKKAEGKS